MPKRLFLIPVLFASLILLYGCSDDLTENNSGYKIVIASQNKENNNNE